MKISLSKRALCYALSSTSSNRTVVPSINQHENIWPLVCIQKILYHTSNMKKWKKQEHN